MSVFISVIASSYKTASLAADKYNTKKLLKENNIKTPQFHALNKPYNIDDIEKDLPIVLKTPEGQGGTGVKVAVNGDDINEFLDNKSNVFTEEYVEGFEVSIEVLRWNNESVALTPVYKGDTTLNGTHPLKKIKQAPLEIEGIDNVAHNRDIRLLAQRKLDYVIELNTRPSGTRYMTAATTNIYPLCQLVDMAKGHWSAKDVRNSMENYYSTELPIGNFPQENIPSQKRFSSENSYIVHGPKNYQRLTIRATSRNKLNNLTYELVSDYANANNIHFN